MKEEYIKLTLSMPVSINEAYLNSKIGRVKSKKCKDWIKLATNEMLTQTKYNITGDNWLFLEYEFNFSLFTLKGKKRIKDVGNYEKILTDFLCTQIKGFEDHKIERMLLSKVDSDKNIVKIKIKELGI